MNTLEREIEFRGKDENGKWWYGGYYTLPDGEGGSIHRIAANYCTNEKFEFHDVVVKPETVGQFTGLTDRKGNKIYEGDIIEGKTGIRHLIKYDEESAAFIAYKLPINEFDNGCHIENDWVVQYEKKVIGNKSENPNLMM